MPLRLSNQVVSRRNARSAMRMSGLAAGLIGSLAPAFGQSLPIVSPQYGEPPQPTAITVHLLAVARPTVAFLARSSQMAEARASRRLRALARREARDQDAAAVALDAAASPTLVTGDPLDAAAVGAATVDEDAGTMLSAMPRLLRTPGARAIAADRAIAAAGRADLGRLQTVDGRGFDALYEATQADGLRRLVALYRDYTQNGDDETLRAMTVRALPRVVALLAAFERTGGAKLAKAER